MRDCQPGAHAQQQSQPQQTYHDNLTGTRKDQTPISQYMRLGMHLNLRTQETTNPKWTGLDMYTHLRRRPAEREKRVGPHVSRLVAQGLGSRKVGRAEVRDLNGNMQGGKQIGFAGSSVSGPGQAGPA